MRERWRRRTSALALALVGADASGNELAAGSVVAIRTSAGRYAKLGVDSYGSDLGITWRTYT